MNEPTTTQTTELVFRRFSEPFKLFSLELHPWLWFVVLGLVLLVAFFYVGWMYLKDSRSVGPWWASLLGLLRCSVYLLLSLIFLLPARQTWEDTKDQSKVLILFDGTPSMTETRDDPPEEGKPFAALPTRQDKVLSFLQEKNLAFLKQLMETNPVTIHRFGSRIDDYFYVYSGGLAWSREDLEARQKEADPTKIVGPRLGVTTGLLSAWIRPNRKDQDLLDRLGRLSAIDQVQGELRLDDPELALLREYSNRDLKNGITLGSEEKQAIKERLLADRERITRLLDYNVKILDTGLFNATNVPDTVMALLNKEINKMVQGIIVVTDGRNTSQTSTQTLLKLEQQSRAHKIPIFVVGVGTERPQVRIDVVDLRAPKTIRPEDQFKAVVDVVGEGLPEQPANVTLEVSCVSKKGDGKEEPDDIRIQEFDPKGAKGKEKPVISLGKKPIVLQPIEPVKFDKNTPPRATAEFQIDAASLARAAGVDLSSEMYRGKKWEIVETTGGEGKVGTEIRFVAKVPKDKLEVFPDPEHLSRKVGLQVVRKPVQVLLFASSSSREFQFLRTLLIREMDADRVLLSIYLQPPPGSEPRQGIVHGIPPKRQLENFPDKFDQPSEDEDAKLMDLASYDVLVAFDPDWTQLTEKQLENVQKWADRGNGLIVIGGPINTLQLARPGAYKDKLKPILDLYPVVLKDIRIDELDRKPDRPWPLVFSGATPEMEFLRLSDEVEHGTAGFLSDWQQFWGRNQEPGKSGEVNHGIFSYYPVDQEKAGTIVVARFGDPLAKDKNGQQMPFLVMTPEGTGRRVLWIGSGELWRLRQFKEMFHERFWTKLIRFTGSSSRGTATRRITPYLGRSYPANKPIRLDAKIFGKGGEPLGPKSRPPEVLIKAPAGVPQQEVPADIVMKPKPGSQEYYEAVFQIRSKGVYELEIRVPETKDVVNQRFEVTPSNPELDNTRPDFDLMYRLASEADLVLARMSEGQRQELRRRLTRPASAEVRPAGKVDVKTASKEKGDDKFRLYFDLKNAELIPSCMIADVKNSRSRGPVSDLWDGGWVLRDAVPPQQPVKLSYALVIGVGLLSLEWLIRKLLRLA